MDYPDHAAGEQIEDFLEKREPLPPVLAHSYFIELLQNDADQFEPLVEIAKLLSAENFELRLLTQFRQNMLGNGKITTFPAEKIRNGLKTLLSSGLKDAESCLSKCMTFLLDGSEDSVKFDRLNTMVEFIQCYPLHVKFDKNASQAMDDCLVPKGIPAKFQPKNKFAEVTEDNRASKLMMFVWAKMCDQQKNIGQTFRIFDTKNKGKLRKDDFIEGLRRFTITLSSDDANCLWESLDHKKRGYLIFEDFAKIAQGDQPNLMNDPYI